jgi:uncharacterized membrane protein YgcG
MIISTYNSVWLKNLAIVKDAKVWMESTLITSDQFNKIVKAHPCGFYHPNLLIRITLFIATWIGISGVSGLFILMLDGASETVISGLCIIYGGLSILVLEKQLIRSGNHYKSGVTEAILYQALGFIIGGTGGLTDFNEHVMLLVCIFCFTTAAIRYHDLVLSTLAIGSFFFFLFYELYELGDPFKQAIPIVMMLISAPLYFYFRRIKQKPDTYLWENCILVAECASLITFYLAGNYMVVRELSIELMNLNLTADEEIPMALLFYGLTALIPAAYIYFGIMKRDSALLRIGLGAVAFSVYTFKHYFLPEHYDLFLMLSGAFLLGITVFLFRYLKQPKDGITREQILTNALANIQVEAFIISQTMGGHQQVEQSQQGGGGGGSFGGGGASGSF